MITRIYIDNFQCFQQFEWRPGPTQLLLGSNGNGKSSVFKVIELLKRLITGGAATVDLFHRDQLNAWAPLKKEQVFEIELRGIRETLCYRLVVEHDLSLPDRNWIKEESVTSGAKILYRYDGQMAYLYQSALSEAGFPFESSRSALPNLPEKRIPKHLAWFLRHWHSTMIYAPDPLRMRSTSDRDGIAAAEGGMEHLASWLRHVIQESLDVAGQLRDSLKEAWPSFQNFRLERAGESSRILMLDFRADHRGLKPYSLSFKQLSDGQRCLVALYLILHAAVKSRATICLDEPDNFLALREIQPWIIHLKDRAEDTGAQLLIISHHPESVDYLGPTYGTWFYREVDGGPARTVPFESLEPGLYTASEVIARDLVETP